MLKKLVMSSLCLITVFFYAQETSATKGEWLDLFRQQTEKDQEIIFSEIRNFYFLIQCLSENPTAYRKIIGNMKNKHYLYEGLTIEERNHYTQLEALRKYLSDTQQREVRPSEEMNLLMKNFLLISGYMKIEQDADGVRKTFTIFDATDDECEKVKNAMKEFYEEARSIIEPNS